MPAAAWGFVAPALLVIALFFLLPVLAGFALSVTDFDLYALADLGNLRFVGLENYARLLQSGPFWQALGNTLYFVVVGVPLSIGVSLAAALLLNSRLTRYKAFFRTALFAPVVTTLVLVAVVWRYLFHARYGVVNQLPRAFCMPQPACCASRPTACAHAVTVVARATRWRATPSPSSSSRGATASSRP